MIKAPIGKNEEDRLKALQRLKVLDSVEEEIFDQITELASSICNTPIALISLIDSDRQWFKSKHGIKASETPRDISFCGHAIHQSEIFEVKDSSLDERFRDNPAVTGAPFVRFYAGAPLITADGYAIGTLCIVDQKPKSLTMEQKTLLQILSKQVISLFQARLQQIELQDRFIQLNSLTESMSEGMVLQDAEGRILEYNSAALKLLGMSADQLIGKTSLDPYWRTIRKDGSNFPGNEHPAMFTLATGIPQKNIVMGVYKPDESITWISINSTPIFKDSSSKPSHVLCTFSDITDPLILETKLIHSSKMSALGEMSSGMAHEINNPLTIIIGQLGLIRTHMNKFDGKANQDLLKEKLNIIEKAAGRVANITRALKTFSRKSDEDQKLPTSIQTILDETLVLCQEKFSQALIKINLSILSESEVRIRLGEIVQVLLNLLNNSFDSISSMKNPWIEIKVQKKGPNIEFSVTDSGPRIPQNIQEKMIQPFFTTKEIGKGTGLGLSISKGLIEGHGGKFYYDNNSPHCRFVFELPYEQ